jgi:hypothetical protein
MQDVLIYGALYGASAAGALLLFFRIRDKRHAQRELAAYLRWMRKGGPR